MEHTAKANHNLFVVIVGVAAWVHSSWTFASVIGGNSPVSQILGVGDGLHWLYWFLPAAASAAAIDVGMINLAEQFKHGRGSTAKLVTFGVLSCISYIAQALFALSHGGSYEPSAGLSPQSAAAAHFVWELLIWALPGALPITLILWAWADTQGTPTKEVSKAEFDPPTTVEPVRRVKRMPKITYELATKPIELEGGVQQVICEKCGWKKEYPDEEFAYRGLSMHLETCPGNQLPANVE